MVSRLAGGLLFLLILAQPSLSPASEFFYYTYGSKSNMTIDSGKVQIELDTSQFGGWAELYYDFSFLIADAQPEALNENSFVLELSANVPIDSVLEVMNDYQGVQDAAPVFRTNDDYNYYLSDKILVLFNNDITPQKIDSLANTQGLTVFYNNPLRPQLYVFESPQLSREALLNIANQIYELGVSVFAKLSFFIPAAIHNAPDDQYYEDQYYLHPDRTDFQSAYEYYIPAENTIKVAILDSGYEDHADLPDSMVIGGQSYIPGLPSYYYGLPDACSIIDSCAGASYHGIAVAGVLAAISNNGDDISGCSSNARLIIKKIFDCGVGSLNEMNVMYAIMDAVDEGAIIISNSWTFKPCSDSISQPVSYAINYAVNNGVVVVFSSGNCICGENNSRCGGSCVPYPASLPQVFTVGASDLGYNLACFSMYKSYDTLIDVVAPGVEIYTLDQMGSGIGYYKSSAFAPECYGEYDVICGVNGTSYAAPQVSALAAMIMGRRPDFIGLPDSVRKIIRYSTGSDWHTPPVEGSHICTDAMGYGIINAAKAMLAISRGDVNNDAKIDLLDNSYLINYLYYGGPAPEPNIQVADVNCSGTINLLDIIYLINYLYQGGPRPPNCFKF